MTEKLLTIFVLFLLSGLSSCDAGVPEECDGISFYASLQTGFIGATRTYWTLRNVDTGTNVLSGGGGGSGTIEIEECLDQACYEFEIEDDCGDGAIQSYFINLDGEQIYYSDGQFGYGEKVSFCAGGCDDYKFSLSLLTDYYPEEISWELRKFGTGSQLGFPLVTSGDGYNNVGGYYYYQEKTNIYVEQCINPGCYGFQISDDYGDGICLGSDDSCGNYEISVDEQQIYYSNGQYGSGEQLSFCVGSTGCVDSPLVIADLGKDCADVANNPSLCAFGADVFSHCPSACNVCADYACEDSSALVEFNGDQYSICALLESQDESVIDDRCALKNVASTCRKTCGNCVYPQIGFGGDE